MVLYPRRAQSGFTLIELLVVVSIISVIIAMLLPVLSSARKAAHRATCLSNLRQLGLAVMMYESDYGYLPPHHLPNANSNPSTWEGVSYKAGYPNWATVLRRLDYVTSIEPDERYPVSGVFRCAAHAEGESGSDNTDPTLTTPFNNYYYTSYVINHWYRDYPPSSHPYRNQGITMTLLEEIVAPSDTVVLADGNFYYIHQMARKRHVARRHLESAHLLMADGHVEGSREPFTGTDQAEPLWSRGLRR